MDPLCARHFQVIINETSGRTISESVASTARTQPPAQLQAPVANANGIRVKFEIKNFALGPRFDGKESEFQDNAFQLKLVAESSNVGACNAMEKAAKRKGLILSQKRINSSVSLSDLPNGMEHEKTAH